MYQSQLGTFSLSYTPDTGTIPVGTNPSDLSGVTTGRPSARCWGWGRGFRSLRYMKRFWFRYSISLFPPSKIAQVLEKGSAGTFPPNSSSLNIHKQTLCCAVRSRFEIRRMHCQKSMPRNHTTPSMYIKTSTTSAELQPNKYAVQCTEDFVRMFVLVYSP
jgi:hypothetical protein